MNSETYLRRVEELIKYLDHLGYKRSEVQQQIDRATNVTRTEALTRSETKNTERVPLVVTFHSELPSLGKFSVIIYLPTLYISNSKRSFSEGNDEVTSTTSRR